VNIEITIRWDVMKLTDKERRMLIFSALYALVLGLVLIGILTFCSSASASEVKYTHYMVHHTDTPATTISGKPYPAFTRDFCKEIHKRKNPAYTDCGYNFMVDRDGTVHEGRPLGVQGAHCVQNGMNRLAIGVALVLKGEEEKPYPGQMEAVMAIKHQYEAATGTELILTYHGEHGATACPGKYVKGQLEKGIVNGPNNI
jgi:hypothetical protein